VINERSSIEESDSCMAMSTECVSMNMRNELASVGSEGVESTLGKECET